MTGILGPELKRYEVVESLFGVYLLVALTHLGLGYFRANETNETL